MAPILYFGRRKAANVASASAAGEKAKRGQIYLHGSIHAFDRGTTLGMIKNSFPNSLLNPENKSFVSCQLIALPCAANELQLVCADAFADEVVVPLLLSFASIRKGEKAWIEIHPIAILLSDLELITGASIVLWFVDYASSHGIQFDVSGAGKETPIRVT